MVYDAASRCDVARQIGWALEERGECSTAESLYVRAMDEARALPPDHPSGVEAARYYGVFLINEGRYAEADPLMRRAVEGRAAIMGINNPHTLFSRTRLAECWVNLGHNEEAEELLRRVIDSWNDIDPTHPFALHAMADLALYLGSHANRLAEAEEIFRQVAVGTAQVFGPANMDSITAAQELGACIANQGRPEEALPILCQARMGLIRMYRNHGQDDGPAQDELRRRLRICTHNCRVCERRLRQ